MMRIIDHTCSKCHTSESGYYYQFIGNWVLCEPCLDKHATKKHYRTISQDNPISEALEESNDE